jgi:hypothetical protein
MAGGSFDAAFSKVHLSLPCATLALTIVEEHASRRFPRDVALISGRSQLQEFSGHHILLSAEALFLRRAAPPFETRAEIRTARWRMKVGKNGGLQRVYG